MYYLVLLIIIKIIILLVYYLFKQKHDYWKKRNVPYLKPTPLFGNYGSFIMLKECSAEIAQRICKEFPEEPYVGTFYGTEPSLLIQDPDLIKLALTKDFYYFSAREISKYTHNEVFTKSLFFTYGDRWKVLRQNLTPLFTSGKMKNMFHLIQNHSETLENLLKDETRDSEVVDVRQIMVRYTMDCISSCTLGVEAKTQGKDQNNPFLKTGLKIFVISYLQGFKTVVRAIWPAIFYSAGLKLFSLEIDRFFQQLLKKVFEQRNHEPTTRNDFVDLMLSLKKEKVITSDRLANMTGDKKQVQLEFDDGVMVGQSIGFFGAGFETSALTVTFVLYELAKNVEAQERAFEEIDQYLLRHEGRVEYDCLTELPYLNACIYEAMRLYPVLGLLTREMEADYTLPTGLLLKKGLRIHIPVRHLQRNPKYFPDPEEFKPERFLEEAKKDIYPYTYLPFGEGPRACIGSRFAKMQMLPGLLKVLKLFRLELAENTPRKLTMDPRAMITLPMEPINLKLIPRC